MKNYKVAVIDTSINTNWLVDIAKDKIEIIDYFEYKEKNVHCSLVINTIFKYTDKVDKIYAYNVFNSETQGSGIAVISALEDIIEKNDIDFLVMSMTLTNVERYDRIKNLCEKIESLGVVILVADSNRPQEGICYYPFSFNCVFGISSASFFKEPYYSIKNIQKKHISGDATPEFILCGNNKYVLFGGTSKAAPKLLGIIIELYPFDSQKEGIADWLKNNTLTEEENCINIFTEDAVTDNDIYCKLCSLIKHLSFDFINSENLSASYRLDRLGSDNLVVLLNSVFEGLGLEEKPENLKYTDFFTMGNLCDYIERRLTHYE